MALGTARSYRAAAMRRWPRAELLGGCGPFATVARCGGVVSVELHRTAEAAARTLDFINEFRCGHACRRQHAVYDLREAIAATPAGGQR